MGKWFLIHQRKKRFKLKTGKNYQMLKNGLRQLSVSPDVHQNKKFKRRKKEMNRTKK